MADETKEKPEDQDEQGVKAAGEQGGEEAEAPALPANKITIEDLASSRKKITVEIDREKIDAKFEEIFGELHKTALVPGFRIGHAPRRLLEKRYGKDAAQDVRNGLVAEALGEVDKNEELDILGEPDIKLDDIELPEKGNLTFTLEIEVKPKFEVPEYKGIAIAEPQLPASAEHAEEVTKRILSQRGTLVPVTEAAQAGDQIIANVTVTGEGIEHKAENAEMRVAPGAVAGVPMEDLAEKLTGAKPGQTVEIKTKVPEGHENEAWRGKDVTVSFALSEIKRMELPPMTDALAGEFGFDNADAMRQYIAQRAEAQITQERLRARREQVSQYLLEHTTIDLPEEVTKRQTATVLRRHYVDLLQKGVPRDQIDQNLELLASQAERVAQHDLKLGFILEKIAKAENITVEEGEVNSWIAYIASQQGRRPERLRQEMESSGSLSEVEVQIREQKTLDKVLEMAESKPADTAGAEAAAKEAGEVEKSEAKGESDGEKKPAKKKGGSKKKSGGDAEKTEE
jgi:trigger factor